MTLRTSPTGPVLNVVVDAGCEHCQLGAMILMVTWDATNADDFAMAWTVRGRTGFRRTLCRHKARAMVWKVVVPPDAPASSEWVRLPTYDDEEIT
jgi:hypothetical protein